MCKNNAFDNQRYTSVSLWIHGGDGGQDIEVQAVRAQAVRANDQAKGYRLSTLKSGQWQQVTIALTDLGVAGVTDLVHLRFVNKGPSAAKKYWVRTGGPQAVRRLHPLPAGRRQWVTVPLDELGATGVAGLVGVRFSNTSEGPLPTFYIDDLPLDMTEPGR
jgi:hypothetical protein